MVVSNNNRRPILAPAKLELPSSRPRLLPSRLDLPGVQKDLNESPGAQRLRNLVTALCNHDRRTLSKQGSEETCHFIFDHFHSIGLFPYLQESRSALTHYELKREVKAREKRALQFFKYTDAEAKQRLSELNFKTTPTIKNVSATIGPKDGRKIILGAHYDTDPYVPRGSGADDNASGVAMVLELAQRMQKYRKLFEAAGVCLEFTCFDAEEHPFAKEGSRKNAAFSEHLNTDHMINFDMLGYFAPKELQDIGEIDEYLDSNCEIGDFARRLQIIIPDQEDYYVVEAASTGENIDQAAYDISDSLKVQGQKSIGLTDKELTWFATDVQEDIIHNFLDGAGSDHDSFIDRNISAMFIHDNPRRNPNYHRRLDKPNTLNYEPMDKLANAVEKYLVSFAQKRLRSKAA